MIYMKKHLIFILLSLFLSFTMSGCKDEIATGDQVAIGATIRVTHLNIPSVYNMVSDSEIIIDGRGFQEGDLISFIPRSGQGGETVELPIANIEDTRIVLEYSELLREGQYELRIIRGTLNQFLGKTFLNRVLNANLPDKDGMTVKGTVHANGKGVADVVVSDGTEFAVTDQNGVYYLPSNKKNGLVFISIPSNHEVPVINTVPQFFKKLVGITSAAEIKDFELIPVNNENHAVAFMADMHLANRNNDINQFQTGFMEDLKATSAQYESQNKRFYGITLGDQTWEQYWFANNFKLEDYVNQIKDLDFPIFNTIGNHDYHPYVTLNDWMGANEFRKVLGPTYYSMNIGRVHYIVLDNMQWINSGAAQGVIGERNYNNILDEEQLEWLEKNLSYIRDKSTPIVIATHVPLFTSPNANGDYNTYMQNTPTLVAALSEFSNVKVLTGHSHINYRIQHDASLSEHNIGAVSATWWWTGADGYAGNHICKDGSPGGYAVWEAAGRDQKWHYKGIGYEKDYQFRSYDLNTVHITAAAHTPGANETFAGRVPSIAGEYAIVNNRNEVLLNVWGYQDDWQITVTENGTTLPVQRVRKKDPLHLISYDLKRINVNAEPTSSFTTTQTAHLFLATASSPTSTLEITVRDSFGNQYKETMVRPKAFTYLMR